MNNSDFEKVIQYTFQDKELLNKALTHSSFCREHAVETKNNNERLEFLGDAFLDAIIGVALYNRLSQMDEGKLTKTRALIVCEKSLAQVAVRLHIGDYLNMGKGEELSGGRHRDSIMADAVEAVIGAIYMDGGYDEAVRFVLREFAGTIEDAVEGKLFTDYKTQVQEALQKRGKKTVISYHLDKEIGPDHDKTFYVHLVCNGKTLGSGCGKSKKEAEQNAAKATIEGGMNQNVL
ncbi:ribonuclease III [Ihubacter sp. mB4P-1]|uniref:ribonuclease III n=1 Tax=Ihubacter sp. mB4P-1 TaxID=3242370 RepID=UPI00137B7EBA